MKQKINERRAFSDRKINPNVSGCRSLSANPLKATSEARIKSKRFLSSAQLPSLPQVISVTAGLNTSYSFFDYMQQDMTQ
jgi:hypothetical protein